MVRYISRAMTDKNTTDPVFPVEANEPAKRRDRRRVFRTVDLPDEWFEAVKNAKVPDEYAYLDEELKDWKPEE
jgi:hypothetical protein